MKLSLVLLMCALLLTLPGAADAALSVTALKCEYATDPMGVDVPQPRLFWQVQSDERRERQTAYQVLAASSPSVLAQDKGDLWDSGRVASDQTTHVRYGGALLKSSQPVWWKVRAWDRNGRIGPWSQSAIWTMGLLAPEDWKGVWIVAQGASESLLLRRDFAVKPGLRRAVAYACGLGQYELSFNGQKAGDDLLSPGWTNYDRTTLYETRDVTQFLKPGPNAAGFLLGNGIYNVTRRDRFAKFTGSFGPLRAILHLRLEYADGTTEFVGTDGSWRTLAGPLTFSNIYGGEDCDARLLPGGWDKPGFDDRDWPSAVVQVRPPGTLRGQSASTEPIRAIEVRKPIGVKTFEDGSAIYDLGQNTSWMPRFRVSGQRGSAVRLTPAEVVNEDGTINRSTMGSPARGISWWQYTKATNEPETWFPKFFYVGCRYLKAECFPTEGTSVPPRLESLEGVIVHSTVAPVGHFACSNPLLNQTRDLVRWAQRSNLVSVLTDSPHREKLGWLEQYHLNGPSIRYEFDLSRLFAKGTNDMAEAQTDEGLIPNIAPEYTEFKNTFRAAAEWGAAYILVPWQQYQFCGDVDLLRAHYPNMKRYFAYLEGRAKNDILDEGLGDWYDLGPKKSGASQHTPPPITASAFFYQDAALLSQIAALLGENEDAKTFGVRAEQLRASYNREFFHADAGNYATNSQASNALPLVMNIAPPQERERVLASLVKDVEARDDQMTAGDVGFRYLLLALAEGGKSDVIYRMINQTDKPGYGFQIKKGETALTESWDANLGSSHNHFMLGQIIEWFYAHLVGIQSDPDGPGFKKIIFNPQPVGDLTWAEASYDSIHGAIALRWERDGERFKLNATVPTNTTATLFLPARDGARVLESGLRAESRRGVTLLRREGERAVFALESGRYEFETRSD